MSTTPSIGLIAGSGALPLYFVQQAKNKNIKIKTVAIRGEASPRLNLLSDAITWISIGQVGSLMAFFKKNGVHRAVMHGKIQHAHYFKNVRLDWKALALWARLKDRSGESLLKGLATDLSKNGTRIMDCRFLMEGLLARKGWVTKSKFDLKDVSSLKYGLVRARALAGHGVGQSLIVKKNAVVAVEAMEGTDEVIQRAGKKAGPGTILFKVSSPRQDWRFDVPTVGLRTIQGLARVKAKGLVLEARKVFILERDKTVRAAEKSGIFILAV